MIDYIESKFGSRKIYLGYHAMGRGAEIYLDKTGKYVGNFAEVLTTAERKAKKRGK